MCLLICLWLVFLWVLRYWPIMTSFGLFEYLYGFRLFGVWMKKYSSIYQIIISDFKDIFRVQMNLTVYQYWHCFHYHLSLNSIHFIALWYITTKSLISLMPVIQFLLSFHQFISGYCLTLGRFHHSFRLFNKLHLHLLTILNGSIEIIDKFAY